MEAMWVRRLRSVAATYIALCAMECAARANPCREIARAIDAEAQDASDPDVMLRLAPFTGVEAAKRLLFRARSAEDELAFYAYLAVGLSRHSEALRLLRDAPRAGSPTKRLGRSLALLALGDGSESATISTALFGGPLADRRRAARALSHMPQKRPRMMLYGALEDADDQVRLSSSRVLFQVESIRARRALLDLFRLRTDAVQKQAVRALLKSGYLFKPDEMAMLTQVQRIQSIVVDAARGRRSNLKLLGPQIRSTDEVVRGAAFAALALLGPDQAPGLHKAEKLIRAKQNMGANAELSMSLALMNDAQAMGSLDGFDKPAIDHALMVLIAFASVGPPKSQLEPDQAGQLARAIESWIQRGLLDEPQISRAIRSMERCDPLASLKLARTRLSSGPGESLRTAVRLIGRSGSLADIPQLMDIAKKESAGLRSEAFRAAARVCSR
jgi:hypothetical protein